MKRIHIGEEIEKRLKEIGMPISEFATKISCSRSTAYYIFKSESIDIKMLLRISRVLNYDFIGSFYYRNSLIYDKKAYIAIPVSEEKIDCITRIVLEISDEPEIKYDDGLS